MSQYRVVEICAGAAGNQLGLELAGFEHDLSVELDPNAAATLRHSGRIGRPPWGRSQSACLRPVIVCWRGPAGRWGALPVVHYRWNKLGATYERDLFAWAIELGGTLQPRALMLENVRGLSLLRFAAYHQHVRDLLWTPPGRPLRRANRAVHWRLASELARGFRGGNVGTHGAVLVEAHRSGRQAETPPAAGLRPDVGHGGEVAQRARDRLGDDDRDARECDGFDDTRQPFRGAGAAVNFRAITAPLRRF